MEEIVEIRNMIREKIERRKRRRWSFLRTLLINLILAILFGGFLYIFFWVAIAIIYEKDPNTASRIQIVIGLIFLFSIIVLSIWATKEDEKIISSLTEKDVVDEVRRLLIEKKGKYHLNIERLSKYNHKLFGAFDLKDIDKIKFLVNYDFSLSSYPNLFGSTLRWATYDEIKNAGLICGKMKEKIAEKVKELEAE